MSARFIVFEGIDGTGKTTQIELAREWLAGRGIEAEFHREPGGTPVGERVRALLLDPAVEITPPSEMMLFFASRAQLAEERVRPALREGRSVILDRYYFSTAAYQGPRVPGGMDSVFALAAQLDLPSPDLVVCLDGDPEALARRLLSGKADRIEAKGIRFQIEVRKAYHKMAANMPSLFSLVDATRSVEEVHRDIAALLKPLYPEVRAQGA